MVKIITVGRERTFDSPTMRKLQEIINEFNNPNLHAEPYDSHLEVRIPGDTVHMDIYPEPRIIAVYGPGMLSIAEDLARNFEEKGQAQYTVRHTK